MNTYRPDFVDTYPTGPGGLGMATVNRLRALEGQVDDEHDAALDCEAEAGRAEGSARGLVLTLITLAIAMASAAYQLWPHVAAFLRGIL